MNSAAPATDPLANLKPIHLPPEPSLWPPAIGWWLLLLLIFTILAGLIFWWRRRQQRQAPLKQALQEIDTLEAAYSGQLLLSELNKVLRRAAGLRHGAHIAALSVEDWTGFLRENAPEALEASAEIWSDLAESAYRPISVEFCGQHIAHSRAWVKEMLAC